MPTKTETDDPLEPGERYGLTGYGWPPLSVVRDMDGTYHESGLSDDLKRFERHPITACSAARMIADADADRAV